VTSANVLQLVHAFLTPLMVGMFLASQVAQVGLGWVASKLVGSQEATLGRALLWYLFNLLWILAAVAALGLGGVAAKAMGLPVLLDLGLGAIWLALFVGGFFFIPMRLYRVGTGGALVMMALVWLGGSGLNYAARRIAGPPRANRELALLAQSAAHKAARLGKPPDPLPSQVTVVIPVKVPVKLDGKMKGSIQIEPGTRVRLLGFHGERVEIEYLDSAASIPTDDTDL
jgi:hypothetical protein